MVNDAQTPNTAPQSMSEWIAEHCRFNIGELDNLNWHEGWYNGHFAYADGTIYFSEGEMVIKCTAASIDQCLSKCPMQVDTVKHYLSQADRRAVPN